MSDISTSSTGVAAARARYEELFAKGRTREAGAVPSLTIALDRVRMTTDIPAGWYVALAVSRGEIVQIETLAGGLQVAAQIWNARDPSERFNAGDTVKVQWSAALGAGRLLLSDMGRVLFSMLADTGPGNDAVSGVSSPASNRARFGDETLRSARENFLAGAAKLGLDKRDLHPAISFFSDVRVGADERFHWGTSAAEGARVDLKAAMDLLLIVSNTPHPLAPTGSGEGGVRLAIGECADAALGDFCRTRTEEAVRAFENTDAYLAG
ncbi:MAG: DUF1989 domain-containing protein [Alphaproteobacteria bacterium]|nr:DUF1989 domain-containing protein [Alphaproteobacteria bacterium]